MKTHAFTRRLALALLLVLLPMIGCTPAAPAEDDLGLSISVLNYTDDPFGVVYVDDVWAGNMGSHRGGTGIVGGYGVPRTWRPGMMVKVEWQDDALYDKDKEGLYRVDVEIPKYTEKHPGILWVAFFPGHQVKVFVSSYGPGHPLFPQGLKPPMDLCDADPVCKAKF